MSSTASAPSGAANESSAQDLVLRVAGVIGTGIGVLGFVAFFGGAVLWLRADQAGLPANDAVSAIPNSVLVTTGASFLVPALLIAMLAVTLIFAVYLLANLKRQNAARGSGQEIQGLRQEVEDLRKDAKKKGEYAATAANIAATAARGLDGPDAKELSERAQARTSEKVDAEEQLRERELALREKEALADGRLTQTTPQFWVELCVGFAAVLILAPVLNKAIFSLPFFTSGLILVGVAVAAAAMSALVYMFTRKRIWFGLSAFIAIGIYIGFATYYSTTSNLKVEPAAALRGERAPVVGSFIADTSESLYLATFPKESRPHLIVIPRAEVTSLVIGPLTDPGEAPETATRLALEECRQRVDVPSSKEQKAHTKLECTPGQRKVLRTGLLP
jgi:hypothetical protein